LLAALLYVDEKNLLDDEVTTPMNNEMPRYYTDEDEVFNPMINNLRTLNLSPGKLVGVEFEFFATEYAFKEIVKNPNEGTAIINFVLHEIFDYDLNRKRLIVPFLLYLMKNANVTIYDFLEMLPSSIDEKKTMSMILKSCENVLSDFFNSNLLVCD
jgi:hypothetical protein